MFDILLVELMNTQKTEVAKMEDIIIRDDIIITVAQQQKAKRVSALFNSVRNSVWAITENVDVIARRFDDAFCVHVSNIKSQSKFNEIKAMLDRNYCESLEFLKSTKTTMSYVIYRREA